MSQNEIRGWSLFMLAVATLAVLKIAATGVL